MKYDLSISLPSIRTQNVIHVYNSIKESITNKYTFELIIVGPIFPKSLQNISNVKFILDYGAPSRCVQLASLISEGNLFTWTCDDGLYHKNTLAECIDVLYSVDKKDGIIAKYTEGPNPSNLMFTEDYYKPWTHEDQQLPGIPKDYKAAPVGIYYLENFYRLGGLDCRFWHINMNVHDLAFRVQKNGGILHFSPNMVCHYDHDNYLPIHKPMELAHFENDMPLFLDIYDKPFSLDRIKIDLDNWKDSPNVWLRFKQN